ncbi:MAG TPA: ribosome recycling factor [Candidatus Onthomorpha intestinigallinarum]|uniref:Ribosome-recycling factor n=1 Tax=Candidatus Onthomorpha intestinigallinarum TaxID=2840880 RepID=A0A9D1RH69_9BACT|nr:ribosome recycling factor [Candidatus Onthomorpha intestinigallinarum]
MSEETKKLLSEAETAMMDAVAYLEKELGKLRAGKASPAMLGGVKVDYYGNLTPIENLGNISTPDAKQIVIQPWDKSVLHSIDKAIQAANLGFQPKLEADVVRIVLPPLTEERRKELCKKAKADGENAKVGVRNIRRNILEKVKKLKDGGVPEDEVKTSEKSLQDITDKCIKKIDEVISAKEEEIIFI